MMTRLTKQLVMVNCGLAPKPLAALLGQYRYMRYPPAGGDVSEAAVDTTEARFAAGTSTTPVGITVQDTDPPAVAEYSMNTSLTVNGLLCQYSDNSAEPVGFTVGVLSLVEKFAVVFVGPGTLLIVR